MKKPLKICIEIFIYFETNFVKYKPTTIKRSKILKSLICIRKTLGVLLHFWAEEQKQLIFELPFLTSKVEFGMFSNLYQFLKNLNFRLLFCLRTAYNQGSSLPIINFYRQKLSYVDFSSL